MPLADKTAVANLALDHLGEPYLTDYASDTGTTADAVRAVYPQVVEAVLEAHDWLFATRFATLVANAGTLPGWLSRFELPADCQRVIKVDRTDATGDPPHDFHVQDGFLYLPPASAVAPVAHFILTTVAEARWPSLFADAVAFLIASRLATRLRNQPALSESLLQKHELALAKARKKDAIDLHARQNLGTTENMALDLCGRSFLTDEDLGRGITYDTVRLHKKHAVRAVLDVFPWTFAERTFGLTKDEDLSTNANTVFTLPSNCLRVLKIDRTDGTSLPNDYREINGNLSISGADVAAPVLWFTTDNVAESDWPPAFQDAVLHLLASRLAPKLSSDPNLAGVLLQKHELALAKAKKQEAILLHARQNLGEVANQALDLCGRTFLTDEDITRGITYDTVNLHRSQVINTLLEGHVWSFATKCAELVPTVDPITAATLLVNPAGDNNNFTLTAVDGGEDGNDITFAMTTPDSAALTVSEVGTDVVVAAGASHRLVITGITDPTGSDPLVLEPIADINGVPAWGKDDWFMGSNTVGWSLVKGSVLSPDYYYRKVTDALSPVGLTDWTQFDGTGEPTVAAAAPTAEQVIAAINANATLVTAEASGTVTGVVAAVPETSLSGGLTTYEVYAPAYESAFQLPSDCLRVIKIDGQDIDIPRKDFEIQGRFLLLEEADADPPVIHYISSSTAETTWPSTFKEAVVVGLAAKLAAKLVDDMNVALSLAQRAEMALGKARSKDARETRSNENHGPRQLAARSGLVNARYRNTTRPPY